MSETIATPSADKPLRKRGPQNKAIESYITRAEIQLDIASTDPEIRPLLEARGYDEAEFAAGAALAASARLAFGLRAAGIGKRSLGSSGLAASIRDARNEYKRFRTIARASFPERADRLSLSITGDVPEDTHRFITAAHTSYSAAAKQPHSAKLTKRGYSPVALSALIAELGALTEAAADQDEAVGNAIGSTAERDAAYDALRKFMKELKGVAKGALRGKPALLAKLDL